MKRIRRDMGRGRDAQGGVVLLEALIGLLIFSLGVLALVAMQSVAVSNVSNAKYRVDAALFADELLNLMWVDRGTNLARVPMYAYPGGSATKLQQWVLKVQDPLIGLPKAQALGIQVSTRPMFGNSTQEVTIVLNWQAPDALVASKYTVIGYITDPETQPTP
jgi:type IV pilus assembly protein PilV